ncbi:uncharacterized protein LOC113291304 [Papaver somniferum]|uniref:uncharacterized protein LOC113291304 n=1 Tax=Papaver somniferum TaxID=3469 RepID=UPI000E700E18|nr:uncharacterized protein LOC113291304 [Papaver somniferum]
MLDFNHYINSCGLIPAPKTGIKFSWCNNRAGVKRILCNLDRSVYNSKWLDLYPNWEYNVGARGVSDHGPLTGANKEISKPQNIPFKAFKIWSTHETFIQVVEAEWQKEIHGTPIFVYMQKFKLLKVTLKKWNWETFGDINTKMLQADKNVLPATILSDTSPEYISLLNKLVSARGTQEIISSQLKEFLHQKSRVKWIKDGVANTSFFHTTMKIRNTHNNIAELETNNGSLVAHHEISEELVKFFEAKFKYSGVQMS